MEELFDDDLDLVFGIMNDDEREAMEHEMINYWVGDESHAERLEKINELIAGDEKW